MLRGIPFRGIAARQPNERILRLHVLSREPARQVRNFQMDCGNPCEAGIVRVQGGRYSRKSRQQPVDRQVCSVGAPKETFELGPAAYGKSRSLPFD
jgi:hypothetical protein